MVYLIIIKAYCKFVELEAQLPTEEIHGLAQVLESRERMR